MNQQRLLTGKEAADLLGMSQAWLYQSDVPCVRLGRRRLYRQGDLQAYVSRKLKR